MGTKGNLVLYLDKELVAKLKALGFNLSKTFENHLKHLITQFSKCNPTNNSYSLKENVSLVRSPGFEPGIASLEGLCPKPTRRRPRPGYKPKHDKQENKPISSKAEEAVINTLIAMKANGIQGATCR
jgi:hypothetical protein